MAEPDSYFSIILIIGIVIFIISLIGLILGVVLSVLRGQRSKLTETWEQEGITFLHGPEVVNFSGLASEGLTQIRGNAVMALTDHDLRVKRVLPEYEWRIPHTKIQQVGIEKTFLGKQQGVPVLVIIFEDKTASDQLGVCVHSHEAWEQAIKAIIPV